MGRHVAARQRAVVVRRDRAGRAGRRLPAASPAAATGRAPRWATSTAPRTIAGCSSPSCARTSCGRALCRAIGRPNSDRRIRASPEPERRANAPALAAILSDAFAAHALTSIGARRWRRTASPSASSAGRRTCPTTSRRVACGAVVETAIPEMPRTLANPIRLGFAEPAHRARRAGARRAQRGDPARGGPVAPQRSRACKASGALK